MNNLKTYPKSLPLLVVCCLLLMALGSTAPQPAHAQNQKGVQSSKKSSERFITIDFDNVNIRLFIKYIAELTGKNFVVDKQVQGTVTIVSPTKISEAEAYKVFESVLEVHGFTTISAGAVTKILPSVRARSQNMEILQQPNSGDPGDKIVTQIIPLKYSSPNEVKNVLAPLVNQTSVLIAYTPSNMLIITETLSNINKLMKIIEVLDVEATSSEVVVLPLEHASASSLSKILSTIFRPTAQKVQGATISPVTVVPYDRVNSIIVLADKAKVRKIRQVVSLLDTKMERDEGNIHVFYLQHATADELAKVLNSLAGKKPTNPEGGKAPAISKNVQIMPDSETNSLVITASKDEYAVLKSVIEKLDIPRRMVYLEALIMEVNVDKEFDVGVEWFFGESYSDGDGAVIGRFPNNGDSSVGSKDGELTYSSPKGFSFGVIKEGIEIGGVTFPSIAAVLHAYQDDSDINIISTPQILTTDNKKAEISVGENIPYTTSSSAGESTGNEYEQFEYRDVSTTLSITPHINQSDTLRLEIKTEISKLKDSNDNKPETFKRTVETTVLLNDQGTVVIGGIISNEATDSEFKVPLLGDIPLLGWLFRTEFTQNRKTNMFIFITPRIISNPADIAAVTLEKEDNMEGILPAIQEELHKEPNKEHATTLADMGYEKLEEGDLVAAIQYMNEALDIDSQNPYALVNMGVIYERQGNNTKAIDMYKKAILYGDDELVGQTSETASEETRLVIEVAKENITRLLTEEFSN